LQRWSAGILACINKYSFWRSQNDRRGASRREIDVHRQIVELAGSTRTTHIRQSPEQAGGLRSALHALRV
jgi:hypothetical protein